MENPDDPKLIEHDPNEKAPNRRSDHEISPYWVVSIAAVIFGLYIQNHGLPNTDPWDIGAFVGVAIFLAWNYWPRAPR